MAGSGEGHGRKRPRDGEQKVEPTCLLIATSAGQPLAIESTFLSRLPVMMPMLPPTRKGRVDYCFGESAPKSSALLH